MPEPLGNPVTIHVFVDTNHAGNVVTRRSHTGILIFIQNSPILWVSKRQNTVETSTFGSEFVAMRHARDVIIALRYKLRMFGVPLEGPAQVYCDNQGVVKNASIPESVLSKKHNAINYHAVREAAAAGVLQALKEDTQTNLADLFTKALPADRRHELLSCIPYNL
ncbi:Reverse transcriptase (RNA-dependent DNA polymerase) [Fragilaria crotonensis]|nr:Reverse transcriptase (RNA-dependent DNA polymerase) [Fragilaria crotonensis]